MIKARYFAFYASALFLFSTSLQAQEGCTDSPEAPTVALMLVGVAGMIYGSSLLMKMFRRGKAL